MEGPEAVGCSVGVEGLVGSTRVGASLLKVIVVVFFFALGRRDHNLETSEAREEQRKRKPKKDERVSRIIS
jgi:hypothetical protein